MQKSEPSSYDLVLRGGRVFDPGAGMDRNASIGFRNGCIEAIIESDDNIVSNETRDVSGKIVVPGLIDLHTHVFPDVTWVSVDAERVARASGTTTMVDAGSSGAGNFPGFLRYVIQPSPLRILAFLNVAYPGIHACAPGFSVCESADMALLNVPEAVRVATEHREHIVGIKVRVGQITSGPTGIQPLITAIEIGEATGLPVMAHLDYAPPTYSEVLETLRPGDLITHAFWPPPAGPLDSTGNVVPAVHTARARGVLFDTAHGKKAFAFETARRMLDAGCPPDTISSDVSTLCIDGPSYNVLVTMSKFLNLGMPLPEVVRAVTCNPARALGRTDIGTLRPGSAGDATVLEVREGNYLFHDSTGATLHASKALHVAGMVVRGRWWEL